MWKKNRQESGGMEGALVVLLLACIIIKSGLLAFCLYAARRGRHFCDEKKGRNRKLSRKKTLTNVPLEKEWVGRRCLYFCNGFFLGDMSVLRGWLDLEIRHVFFWKEQTALLRKTQPRGAKVPFETWVMLRYIIFFRYKSALCR